MAVTEVKDLKAGDVVVTKKGHHPRRIESISKVINGEVRKAKMIDPETGEEYFEYFFTSEYAYTE